MVMGELPLRAGARQDFPLVVRHARIVRGGGLACRGNGVASL